MNRYEPSTPRTAFGVIACALTLATFALLVAGPASLVGQGDGSVVMAARHADAPGAIRVLPSVHVVAMREGKVEPAAYRIVQSPRRPQS
jgi:hypothetical protein